MSKDKIAETPLMKQHKEIKARYPDAVLLFRVGDCISMHNIHGAIYDALRLAKDF